MEYRIQSTGELKNQGEVRRMHSNTSLPKVWDANVCEALGIDPVLISPKPDTTGYTQAVRSGATQDANGNWVQAWSVVDMFSDTTEDGVMTTKAEHEAAYQANLDAKAADSARSQRDKLLAECDWTQVLDAPVDQTAWATYRQALRDVPAQSGFPNSIDWPIKP